MVLTGGRSTRLGEDKATAVVAGRRMVDRLVANIPAEVPVVVVGPDPAVKREVLVTREDPPGGGPAAGIAAGLPLVGTDVVAVVAADMPFAIEVVLGLLEQLSDADAVVAHADGHDNGLCAVYRTQALRALGMGAGMSMRAVLAGLAVRRVQVPGHLLADIDTPADLARVNRLLGIMGRDEKGCAMQEWIAAVKTELGLRDEVDVDIVLDVAKDVAHGVQRPAAPVTAYLLGLAVGGGADPAHAAAKIARLAQGWPATEA